MKNKIIAGLLSALMAFTVMPVAGAPAHANAGEPQVNAGELQANAGVPAINLVQNGDAPNLAGGQETSLWYGAYPQSRNASGGFNDDPVRWRILDNDRAKGRLFLLSDMGLDCRQYNEDHLSTTWKKCTLRSWLNRADSDESFINRAFSDTERAAIPTTQIDNPGYIAPGDHSTKDQIFLLSVAESENESYGFPADHRASEVRQVENTEYAKSKDPLQGDNGKGYWWLRSPGDQDGNHAAVVLNDGGVHELGYSVDTNGITVRPAFHLDLGSALFTSSAVGGKPSGTGAGALTELGENTTGEWKLTMKDRAHQDFKVTSVRTYDGKTLYIRYSGAATGGGEYISAIIKTSDGRVKSYGKLAPASGEANATVLLNIDGRMSAGDTLCVFNERCNADRETDFSSPLQEIPIPDPENTDDAVILADENGYVPGLIPTQGSRVYFGKYMQESLDGAKFYKNPVKWRVLWNDEVGGRILLLSDRNLDCKKYNEGYKSTTWETGPLRAWLNGTDGDGFAGAAFSGNEREAIATTRVRNRKADDYTPNPERPGMDGGNDTDDQIFLLSLSDVMNANYGFTGDYAADESRVALNTEYTEAIGDAWTGTDSSGFWWLRSPGYGGEYAATVAANGRLIPGGIEEDRDVIAIRPALNLNAGALLFISPAEGGRATAIGPDALDDPGRNPSGEWKMTLKDRAHRNFRVTSATTCDGKALDIRYAGAARGDGEYITALIKTSGGKVKYIGNLAAAREETGTTRVNIDGMMDAGDTLCVFNRQINEDRETDFSSPLQEIPIPAKLHDRKAATCTQPGTCRICGLTLEKPLGHSYGAWTRLNDKQHRRVCAHDSAHVEKANHVWDAGRVTRAATTTAAGVRTCTCAACRAAKTEAIPRLAKKANPLKVKGKTVKVKYSKLKKKNQSIKGAKAIAVTDPRGKVSYKKVSVTYAKAGSVNMSKKALKKYKKKAPKKIKIDPDTGRITVKKGLKKGTYRVTVQVRASGNAGYEPSAQKTATVKIKVK